MKKNNKVQKDCKCQDMGLEIEELKKKCLELEESWKRSVADFANFKKRSEEEKRLIFDVVRADVASSFLPVYDSISRGLQSGSSKDDGLEKIMRVFETVLKSHGIEKVTLDLKKFDPELAEAVGYMDNDDKKKSGQIAAVVEEAFGMGSKIIRPAKVMIFR
mgnify:CR=1 FL=1